VTASFIWATAFYAFYTTAEIRILVTLSLKELGKTMYKFSIPHSENILEQHSTSFSVRDGVACE